MIFNIRLGTFGGPLRLGDLLGVANVVEHFRRVEDQPTIRFCLEPSAISDRKYVRDFYDWLVQNSDYFSQQPGTDYLPWQRVNIWDYRDISGDLIELKHGQEKQKKIVLNPLFDAEYNLYRNWPPQVFDSALKKYSHYQDYDKVIVSGTGQQASGWRSVTDMNQVLQEILTCEKYIGGSTGLSLFASALIDPPEMTHVMSSRCLLHTLPFRWQSEPRCKIQTYWLDFENTKW